MTHNDLVLRAVQWLRAQGYHAALAEPMLAHELPDAIGWDGRGRSAVIECKVSRSDFKADLKKPVHTRKDETTFGNHRWFMAPRGLLKASEIPKGHGLLEITEQKVFVALKAPERSGHNERLERSILAQVLGRVQREHFSEAFDCPEAYMDARIWARGLVFEPETPDPQTLELDTEVLLPSTDVKTETWRKLACVSSMRASAGKALDVIQRRSIATAIPTMELITALAHLRRAEQLLSQAARRQRVSSKSEEHHA